MRSMPKARYPARKTGRIPSLKTENLKNWKRRQAESEVRSSKPDMSNMREWLNAFAALGALFVGVVSFWTTARISGLEDYLRSEIIRRNSDLNDISNQSRRLGVLADERSERLAALQTVTDEITATNLSAQAKLLYTQQELSRLAIEAASAKQSISYSEIKLSTLAKQTEEQSDVIDLFRRQRFYETVSRRVILNRYFEKSFDQTSSQAAYYYLTRMEYNEVGSDLSPYVENFRKNAERSCRALVNYNPVILPQLEYPKAPKRPGDISKDGKYYLMSNKEYDNWMDKFKKWNDEFDNLSKENSKRRESEREADQYIANASAKCICQALATSKHSAAQVCPGQNFQNAPLEK